MAIRLGLMVAIPQGNTAPPDLVASRAVDQLGVATVIPHPPIATPRLPAATAAVMEATMAALVGSMAGAAVDTTAAVEAEDSTAVADIANSQAF